LTSSKLEHRCYSSSVVEFPVSKAMEVDGVRDSNERPNEPNDQSQPVRCPGDIFKNWFGGLQMNRCYPLENGNCRSKLEPFLKVQNIFQSFKRH